jgi:signal transduction histidine kinase
MEHHIWRRRGLLAVIGLFAFALVSATLVSSLQWVNKPFPSFFLHENLTVGPYFLPGWSASAAGLKSLDRVMAIDGRPLRQRAELYDLVKRSPTHSAFRYQIMRDGKMLELTIPSMILSFHDWFLSFGVYVIMGIAFLIIGAAPYYLRAASPAALPLCFMVLAVFVWFETTFDFMTAGVWPKEMRIFGLTLTPSAAIHLALLLKGGKPLRQTQPMVLVLIYGISVLLGWLNSVTFFGPTVRWIHIFQAGYIFTCAGALAFLLIVGFSLRGTLPNLERSRLRVMFVGAVLGFLVPTLCTVLTSSFQWSIPYNIAMVPTVFFPFSVAYALLKYSLFDLGNALKVALSRIALTAFLLAMYAVVVLLLGPRVGVYGNDPLVPLFFSVLVVLVFNPLLRWIEGVVDRTIYRQEYDPAQVQEEISLFLRSLAAAPKLSAGFIQRVTDRLGIETANLAYRPKEAEQFLAAATDGTEQNQTVLSGAVQALSEGQSAHYHGVSRGELTTNPRFRQERDILLAVFDQFRSELMIPLIYEREVRGFVSFGMKRSRREYSAEDLRLLVTLTDQLALSLENGRLYDESVRAYNEAEATNKRLVEMDRAKKDFVANICHELRTPVSTIIGYSEVLLDPDFKGDARLMLERLVNNGQELSHLMDNLMNFSRMETDGQSAQFEVIKLKEILTGLEMMTQRLIRERPIEFGIAIKSPIDTIESDGQKLQQILVQLLTNALKFTEKGRIELIIRLLNEGREDFLEIAVADTGIGIRREDQDVIFEEFRQLDGSSSRRYGGTGLGLGLCRKLAAALGGRIQVTSEVGVGSVFSLLLPVKSVGTSGTRERLDSAA